jgi:hypothetical protein
MGIADFGVVLPFRAWENAQRGPFSKLPNPADNNDENAPDFYEY